MITLLIILLQVPHFMLRNLRRLLRCFCGGNKGHKFSMVYHCTPPSSFFLRLKVYVYGYQHLCCLISIQACTEWWWLFMLSHAHVFEHLSFWHWGCHFRFAVLEEHTGFLPQIRLIMFWARYFFMQTRCRPPAKLTLQHLFSRGPNYSLLLAFRRSDMMSLRLFSTSYVQNILVAVR